MPSLQARRTARGAPVLLLHGWEGSADSLYVLSLAQRLFAQGFERGAPEPARPRRDPPPEPRAVPFLPPARGGGRGGRAAAEHFSGAPLQLVGFSLGGNFTLRVAAQARAAQLDLAQVIAVSPVLDPVETLAALQRGFPGYELYFVRKWLRSLRKKQAAWPDTYDFARAERACAT